ncbi:MAG: type II toxin-antitoxin system RelE/ParE family toxin [Rhodospirillales bacterium]|nr:type II toxin-antitoxin system RelE/ParE family toxin [Rhodospirillales bacterium]
MPWSVVFDDAFEAEFTRLPLRVQDELLASAKLLARFGPYLGRPHADALNGSAFANMKELRFAADGGIWRVAFAFDPARMAVLLVAGDKSGGGEKRFYRTLIARADARYRAWLARHGAGTKGRP